MEDVLFKSKDVYPDKVNNIAYMQNGIETYSRQTTQFGFMGAFYYASLTLKF